MGAPAMVVGSNLVVAFLEKRMFTILPQVFPTDFVDFFVRNYFRYIDDVIHQWLENFDISILGQIMNDLDQDIKYELEQLSRCVHYLDVKTTVTESEIIFDIYYKPTNAFTYLKYTSCHPQHTINNLAGSLARRIINIVSENRERRLDELTEHMAARGHPVANITRSISTAMKPHKMPTPGEPIVFTRTHSPRLVINQQQFTNCISNVLGDQMKKAFDNKWVLISKRQPENLRKMLTSAKFVRNPIPREPRRVGLFPCGRCVYCQKGYIKSATGFEVRNHEGHVVSWTYTRFFTCSSKNVLYVVTCNKCNNHFYVGKTKDLSNRTSKHASDVRLPHNSNCKTCANHLRVCSQLIEPYFTIYPFFYEDDPHTRHHLERRFIQQFKPDLNGQ
jgi:hypothetical protein